MMARDRGKLVAWRRQAGPTAREKERVQADRQAAAKHGGGKERRALWASAGGERRGCEMARGAGSSGRPSAEQWVEEVVAPGTIVMVARRGRGVLVALARAGDGERVRCEKGAVRRKYLTGGEVFCVKRDIDAAGQN